MYDILKKIVIAGLDAQDKVVDFMDDMVKKGKMNKEDREKLLKELDERCSESQEKGEELINEIVDTITKRNPFVSKKEVTDLEKKIKDLEEKINELEGKPSKKTGSAKKSSKADVSTPPEVPDGSSNF